MGYYDNELNCCCPRSFVVICVALGRGLEDFTAKRENRRTRTQRPNEGDHYYHDYYHDYHYDRGGGRSSSWPEVNAVEKIKFTKARQLQGHTEKISMGFLRFIRNKLGAFKAQEVLTYKNSFY